MHTAQKCFPMRSSQDYSPATRTTQAHSQPFAGKWFLDTTNSLVLRLITGYRGSLDQWPGKLHCHLSITTQHLCLAVIICQTSAPHTSCSTPPELWPSENVCPKLAWPKVSVDQSLQAFIITSVTNLLCFHT